MGQLFSNNASTTLLNSISDVATSITLATGAGSKFNSPTGGDFELVTIADAAGTVYEIVAVTARTGDVLTITRAMEGTTALVWGAGSVVEARATKGTLALFPQGDYDNSGDTRGTNAVNLQPGRTNAANVASGAYSIAVGYNTKASGWAIAIGSNATATADDAIALGADTVNRVADTHVIAGLSLVRKDNGESASWEHSYFTGSESVVFSKIINLNTLADDVATITIPTGATFYVEEMGVIVTTATGVTSQPSVSFGVTGNTTSLLASTPTTKNAAKGRDVFTPLSKDGVNRLTASVKTAGTGTALSGRFYWRGLLVED